MVYENSPELFHSLCIELKKITCYVIPLIFFYLFSYVAVPTIIIAHEFYDALPIHQFQVCFVHFDAMTKYDCVYWQNHG